MTDTPPGLLLPTTTPPNATSGFVAAPNTRIATVESSPQHVCIHALMRSPTIPCNLSHSGLTGRPEAWRLYNLAVRMYRLTSLAHPPLPTRFHKRSFSRVDPISPPPCNPQGLKVQSRIPLYVRLLWRSALKGYPSSFPTHHPLGFRSTYAIRHSRPKAGP